MPASGFYEWKKAPKGKVPYYVKLEKRELFFFAGLYDIWKDDEGKNLRHSPSLQRNPTDPAAHSRQNARDPAAGM